MPVLVLGQAAFLGRAHLQTCLSSEDAHVIPAKMPPLLSAISEVIRVR